MKVYIVIEWEDGEVAVWGTKVKHEYRTSLQLFSTKEKAEKYIEKQIYTNGYSIEEYVIDEE